MQAATDVRRMEKRRTSFGYDELLACARGELFGAGNAAVAPAPMLMFDRISEIAEAGGKYGKGLVRAVLDLRPDFWFFPCHFKGDPVMPGCLGLDALWQLLGFFLGVGWGTGQRARARTGRAQVLRSGPAYGQECRLWYRHQTGHAVQTCPRYCGRVALGRWIHHLSGAGSQGRIVPRRHDVAADRKLTARVGSACWFLDQAIPAFGLGHSWNWAACARGIDEAGRRQRGWALSRLSAVARRRFWLACARPSPAFPAPRGMPNWAFALRCMVHPPSRRTQSLTVAPCGSSAAAPPWNYVAMEQAIRDAGLEPSEISNEMTGLIMDRADPRRGRSSMPPTLRAVKARNG